MAGINVFEQVLRIRIVPPVVRNNLYAGAFAVVSVVKALELTQLGNTLASRGLPVDDDDALPGVGIDI
jgi:hypothetical protein